MTKDNQHLGLHQSAAYRIVVERWVTDRWKDWFNGMAMTREEATGTRATSRLEGVVANQATILGLLQKPYNLGFPLPSVELRRHPDE